MQHLKFKTVF